MNNKIMMLGVMSLLLVFTGIFVVGLNNLQEVETKMDGEYQGPVPDGYDLEYFRKTGETILKTQEDKK